MCRNRSPSPNPFQEQARSESVVPSSSVSTLIARPSISPHQHGVITFQSSKIPALKLNIIDITIRKLSDWILRAWRKILKSWMIKVLYCCMLVLIILRVSILLRISGRRLLRLWRWVFTHYIQSRLPSARFIDNERLTLSVSIYITDCHWFPSYLLLMTTEKEPLRLLRYGLSRLRFRRHRRRCFRSTILCFRGNPNLLVPVVRKGKSLVLMRHKSRSRSRIDQCWSFPSNTFRTWVSTESE